VKFLLLPLGGLHVKHAVQRGIWVLTQHLLWDQENPRKTLYALLFLLYSSQIVHHAIIANTIFDCKYNITNELDVWVL
jgi:hypothetical protein